MKLVYLISTDGNQHFVNPSHVVEIESGRACSSVISFVNGYKCEVIGYVCDVAEELMEAEEKVQV